MRWTWEGEGEGNVTRETQSGSCDVGPHLTRCCAAVRFALAALCLGFHGLCKAQGLVLHLPVGLCLRLCVTACANLWSSTFTAVRFCPLIAVLWTVLQLAKCAAQKWGMFCTSRHNSVLQLPVSEPGWQLRDCERWLYPGRFAGRQFQAVPQVLLMAGAGFLIVVKLHLMYTVSS